ncbi:unnamed protein product [Microthlaspi erraticum]|uniref:Uncharacterized protein n=1 Tax=Microthlaspi erraticum TaxID=1685480 RepID=A0A6D2JWE1_9BRAS|nr:unnamed protein product [Microthlaspi erraticum]
MVCTLEVNDSSLSLFLACGSCRVNLWLALEGVVGAYSSYPNLDVVGYGLWESLVEHLEGALAGWICVESFVAQVPVDVTIDSFYFEWRLLCFSSPSWFDKLSCSDIELTCLAGNWARISLSNFDGECKSFRI